IEVEHTGARGVAGVVLGLAHPAVVQAHAAAGASSADGAGVAVGILVAAAAWIARRVAAWRGSILAERCGPRLAGAGLRLLQIHHGIDKGHGRGDLGEAVTVEIVDVRSSAA